MKRAADLSGAELPGCSTADGAAAFTRQTSEKSQASEPGIAVQLRLSSRLTDCLGLLLALTDLGAIFPRFWHPPLFALPAAQIPVT